MIGRSSNGWKNAIMVSMRHLLLAAMISLPLLAPLPRPRNIFAGCVWNMLHAPFIFLFAVLLHRLLTHDFPNLPRPRVAATIITLFLALFFEWIQPLFGRSTDELDLFYSVCGVLLYILSGYVNPRKNKRTTHLAVFGLLVVCIMIFYPLGRLLIDRNRRLQAFPVLAGFDNDLELSRWERQATEFAPASDGSASWLVAQDDPWPYPGAFLTELVSDWSDYSILNIDLFNPEATPQIMELRIDDKLDNPSYTDRFQTTLTIEPGTNHFSFSFKEMPHLESGRELQFKHIRLMGLFWLKPESGKMIRIDRISIQ